MTRIIVSIKIEVEMKKMKSKILLFSLCTLVLIFNIPFSYADDWYNQYGGHFKVFEVKTNRLLFETAREVARGDQYLSGDNKLYSIVRVNSSRRIGYAEFIRDVKLPEIDEVAFNEFVTAMRSGEGIDGLLAQAGGNKKVGIYATHSSESYLPTDGAESIKGDGGIFKVAEKMRASFEKNGVEALFDDTPHDSHDAGAYKRSRRTALQLLRNEQPQALIDVHRDAIPAKAYLTDINGEPASKVRLVVGRRNQNFKANEETAWKIKAVADKMYPGLIKDIFYARGDYNQDLTPRAMLLEMGTYRHSRQRAEKSAGFISEVITTSLYGGTFKDKTDGETEKAAPQERSNRGSMTGIAGIAAVIGGGGLAFLFLSSGGKEWRSKVASYKQEFKNFLGRTRKKK